jgi:hypothetical protein
MALLNPRTPWRTSEIQTGKELLLITFVLAMATIALNWDSTSSMVHAAGMAYSAAMCVYIIKAMNMKTDTSVFGSAKDQHWWLIAVTGFSAFASGITLAFRVNSTGTTAPDVILYVAMSLQLVAATIIAMHYGKKALGSAGPITAEPQGETGVTSTEMGQ